MYDNIGEKIKGLAKAVFAIGSILFAILGIVLIVTEEEILIILGVISLVMGPLGCWIGSWFLYGFGELIDKTSLIESGINSASKSSKKERIEKIKNLYAKGLITEKEYQNAISKDH